MINLRVSTSTERSTHIVPSDQTVLAFLAEKEIEHNGAVIMVSGITLTATDYSLPFSALVVGDSALMSVVIKTGNA